jgi:hypothetical protein
MLRVGIDRDRGRIEARMKLPDREEILEHERPQLDVVPAERRVRAAVVVAPEIDADEPGVDPDRNEEHGLRPDVVDHVGRGVELLVQHRAEQVHVRVLEPHAGSQRR